jgi:dipeptidyl aminopeptidase/acylaminoacyl peptidase/uncharacterized protein (DUF885 family)
MAAGCFAIFLGATARGDEPAGGQALEKYAPTAAQLREAYARADRLLEERKDRVFKTSLTPHWLNDSGRFWYRNDLRGGVKEFILIDAVSGTRRPVFDHARLAISLSSAAGKDYLAEHLPFDEIEFVDDGKALRFRVGDSYWKCNLDGNECAKMEAVTSAPEAPPQRPSRFRDRAAADDDWRSPGRAPPPRDERSPDGKWLATVRDYNVVVRATATGEEITLSNNGQPDFAYSELSWSPDSKTLVACRVDAAATKDVYLIESSPASGGRARLRTMPYAQPGDKFSRYEPWLFDLDGRRATHVDCEPIDFQGPPRPRWKRDGRHFTFERTDRGHQRFRVVEVAAAGGATRNVLDETSSTFINGVNQYLEYLDETNELLWKSQRDGWNHLYLVDAQTGQVKQQVTRGAWVVRGVERVDAATRQVWFRASGMHPQRDPYLVQYYRINLDGTGLVELTPGDGQHAVQFSPDRRWLVDTYSRVDSPHVHELRRADDGSLICELERADVSALAETGWTAPEVFHAKGRDGQTEIWGIVCRPPNCEPARRYPVVENIYAGPHDSHVPKSFSPLHRSEALAELGFIVVQIDGMGTSNRSKAFHDVCWKNLADAGFPDRIAWIKALAAKYPHIDPGRVGVYGGSAGGQNAAGAVLFHPEFYDVAVASCGCHDNRLDKTWWNEQWMGYPIGPHYAEQSNITNAHKLAGKLLLIVGELDTNVPPESTFRFADALIKAKKDFEFLVIPGMGHGDGGPYGERRRRDFFVRHLHGVEPPEWNAQVASSESAPAPAGILANSAKATANSASATTGTPALCATDLHEMIEQYMADRDSLRRFYSVDGSPARQARFERFYEGLLAELAALDFDRLGRDGQIDYLLLKNHLTHERRQLGLNTQAQVETAPLLPFVPRMIELADAQQRMEFADGEQAATLLTELEKQLAATRNQVEAGLKSENEGLHAKKTVANRAAVTVDRMRRALRRWFSFYDGYDPGFTWWVEAPYKKLDAALEGYAGVLRERLAGLKQGDRETIVGDPIGREALLSELAAELLPYTPDELLAIAEREFAWCDAEMKKASQAMGYGDDWHKALEHVKRQHVDPGKQPELIRKLAHEAIEFIEARDLVTVPPMARETWRMEMMSPERQLVNPFFTGGEVISVSFPVGSMTHEQKLMSMRGNNVHFARATVFHELVPGHHLQHFMTGRYRPYRGAFTTPFWIEGWALYWEMLLWDLDFPQSPENRVGMLFWRMHRCARIIFSFKFHLEQMTPQECIDFLVERVGHERENASAEVRRSFRGEYSPLYQAAYMLGGLQLRALHREQVDSGKLTNRAFHDAVLKENAIPIELIRARLSDQPLARDFHSTWRFYDAGP